MKTTEFKRIIESTMKREIRKYILKEANAVNEKYHIMLDGEPIATFDSKDKAEEELPKYKKSHPDKELIIEKGVYESYDDMIDKMDEMGQELEEKENMNTEEDIEEMESCDECNSQMREGECMECGGEMREGECMECGYKMVNESKRKTIRLKESDFVKYVSKMVSESIPGLEATKKAQTQTKRDSESHASTVAKKIQKATSIDGNDNPKFPKQIGKGEKVAKKLTAKEDEFIEDFRGGGLEDLKYGTEPSEMFKERAKKAITGDSKLGNSSDAANVIPSDLGEKILKKVERKKKKIKQEPVVSWGHAWKEPTDVNVNESKKKSDEILTEEIKKMKKLFSYNKKTQ